MNSKEQSGVIAGVALAALIACGLGFAAMADEENRDKTEGFPPALPLDPIEDAVLNDVLLVPCAQEDSGSDGEVDCYWDSTRGNGQGVSFVVIDGTYYYGATE